MNSQEPIANLNHTTFRRVDGILFHTPHVGSWRTPEAAYSILRTSLEKRQAENYIEEQWDGDKLLRFREIRLGWAEDCTSPFCEMGIEVMAGYECKVCGGPGILPRNSNPAWTEIR
jgi:hypothetical protein